MKYIYFDWGGVLGKKGMSKIVKLPDYEKYKYLHPGMKKLLHKLSKIYKLGIISNTKTSREDFINTLKLFKIYKYFDNIILSSDKNMCKKKCLKIFSTAFNKTNLQDKSDILYIGNNYRKDIEPSIKYGFKTIFISNYIEDHYKFLKNKLL